MIALPMMWREQRRTPVFGEPQVIGRRHQETGSDRDERQRQRERAS
jgi:hypothetical protein